MTPTDQELTASINRAALEKGTIRPGVYGWIRISIALYIPAILALIATGATENDLTLSRVLENLLLSAGLAAAATVLAVLFTMMYNSAIVRGNFLEALTQVVADHANGSEKPLGSDKQSEFAASVQVDRPEVSGDKASPAKGT